MISPDHFLEVPSRLDCFFANQNGSKTRATGFLANSLQEPLCGFFISDSGTGDLLKKGIQRHQLHLGVRAVDFIVKLSRLRQLLLRLADRLPEFSVFATLAPLALPRIKESSFELRS